MRDGDGPLVAGFKATEGEEDDTPLLSKPKRNFRASYMFTAFLSTLLTITDWKTLMKKEEVMRNQEITGEVENGKVVKKSSGEKN